mmetsp:Transcript_46058/g.71905  ORF Transcript_46058/g.71905 Transcript_46058/m.71905 type:complete len:273 (-) Transcript_46058:624-1442(-)
MFTMILDLQWARRICPWQQRVQTKGNSVRGSLVQPHWPGRFTPMNFQRGPQPILPLEACTKLADLSTGDCRTECSHKVTCQLSEREFLVLLGHRDRPVQVDRNGCRSIGSAWTTDHGRGMQGAPGWLTSSRQLTRQHPVCLAGMAAKCEVVRHCRGSSLQAKWESLEVRLDIPTMCQRQHCPEYQAILSLTLRDHRCLRQGQDPPGRRPLHPEVRCRPFRVRRRKLKNACVDGRRGLLGTRGKRSAKLFHQMLQAVRGERHHSGSRVMLGQS